MQSILGAYWVQSLMVQESRDCNRLPAHRICSGNRDTSMMHMWSNRQRKCIIMILYHKYKFVIEDVRGPNLNLYVRT